MRKRLHFWRAYLFIFGRSYFIRALSIFDFFQYEIAYFPVRGSIYYLNQIFRRATPESRAVSIVLDASTPSNGGKYELMHYVP